MDLNAINGSITDSFEVEIVHPVTGDGGWFVQLASPCHTESQLRVMAVLDKSRKRKNSTPQHDEKDVVALVIARILGWRGLTAGDQEIEFSEAKAAEILNDPRSFWIRSQLVEALGDPTRPFSN